MNLLDTLVRKAYAAGWRGTDFVDPDGTPLVENVATRDVWRADEVVAEITAKLFTERLLIMQARTIPPAAPSAPADGDK